MSFYDDKVLPRLINVACAARPVMKIRRRLLSRARGRVLEVGAGSGLNFSCYDHHAVEHLWALEPAPGMRRLAAKRLQQGPASLEWLDLPGEEIPLPDASVDTVVLTFTLCSIPDWQAALGQMHRVLAPGGRLLFAEHGRAPEVGVSRWQDRLTPVWKKLAGGCHLNRPIADCLESSGFRILQQERFYLEKTPRFAGYLYLGEARPRGG